jgi:hypothetical protein
MLFDGLTNNT